MRDIEKCKQKLNCSKKELSKVCENLEEGTKNCFQLNETNRKMSLDLDKTKTELAEEKSWAHNMEERMFNEREIFSKELKLKSYDLKDMEIRYDDANSKLKEKICVINQLTRSVEELKKAHGHHNGEKNKAQDLRGENIKNNNCLCRLKNKAEENICKKNECNVQKNNQFNTVREQKLSTEESCPDTNSNQQFCHSTTSGKYPDNACTEDVPPNKCRNSSNHQTRPRTNAYATQNDNILMCALSALRYCDDCVNQLSKMV